MKKTLVRISTACGLALLLFASPGVYAFCTEFEVVGVGVNCVDEGHKLVTSASLQPIMRHEIYMAIWGGNFAQDDPFQSFAGDGQRHFESCYFVPEPYVVANIPLIRPGSIDYIRRTYADIIASLDPLEPDPVQAAGDFGLLLHTAQDFYSHSNWINLLGLTGSTPLSPEDLFDRNLGEWTLYDWLAPVRDDIILGQLPPTGLPYGWSATQELTSETPVFTTSTGLQLRGLVTGWNPESPCPDVRAGTTIDEFSHIEMDPVTDQFELVPRTLRLVHGSSELAGIYGLPGAYQSDRPCRNEYPTSMCIQKDTPDRPDYNQVMQLAQYQTEHEWCRVLHLAKDSEYGYAAASLLMAFWADPDKPSGPHLDSTACGTPPEVYAGKPGPLEVTVDPRGALIDFLPGPDGSPGSRNLIFALYTGDFRRSAYGKGEALTDEQQVHLEPLTMCLKPTDTLVATVTGWDDFTDAVQDPRLGPQDRILRGPTWVLNGPNFQPDDIDTDNQDMFVGIDVDIGGEDPDGDGLSTACGEVYYDTNPDKADTDDDGLNDGAEVNTHGTNPNVADTDGDGLNDGAEVNTHHTNPLDTDTDDDDLTDGAEVNTHGTNPLNSDTDDDGLTDGDEVNTYGTDPRDADTDDDGLPDGIEVRYGTNPKLWDTDGDGLPDGKDVEWIQRAIAAIPNGAIKSPAAGNRNAMMNLLNDAEALLLKNNRKAALDKLTTLRKRMDGCGVVPDKDDWIIDCEIQTEIVMLVDLLIGNARA